MSGLSRTPGKRVWANPHRGFESRPLRQNSKSLVSQRLTRLFALRVVAKLVAIHVFAPAHLPAWFQLLPTHANQRQAGKTLPANQLPTGSYHQSHNSAG